MDIRDHVGPGDHKEFVATLVLRPAEIGGGEVAGLDGGTHGAVEDQDALILRVANASTEEIDRLIFELQSVRDMLRREGERVNRDLASYTNLNQHLMTGMKIISENLRQWKGAPESREQAIADFKLRWLTQD